MRQPSTLAGAARASGLAIALLAAAAGSLFASSAAQQEPPRVNADAKVMADFEKRVADYVEQHKKFESTLPDLPKEATPQQIETHQIGLAQQIRRARIHAKPGDIFDKETRALFRRYLARAFAGPDAAALRATIMDENPGRIRLTINGPYPDAVPVPTVPAQVLQSLPKLPPELEYRFVGDRLVLMDVHAQLIVDIIDDALPK